MKMTVEVPSLSKAIEDYLAQRNVSFSEKMYTMTTVMSREENMRFALAVASSVIDIFEKNHPTDTRPRKALEMIDSKIRKKRVMNSAKIASDAFVSAAEVAYNGDALNICVESFSAARAAAHAAKTACVYLDGNISENAYDAVYYALDAMDKNKREEYEDLILILLAEVINEGVG